MKKTMYILCGGILSLVVAAYAISHVQYDINLPKAPASRAAANKFSDHELIQQLQDERIVAFYEWNVSDDQKLSCLVQAFDTNPNWSGPGVRLAVFDKAGRSLYETFHSELNRAFSSQVLRNGRSQLVIESDDGGTGTYFLQILDYQNGKIAELIDARDNDFNVDATVRPSFRSGVHPAEEPFQVLLTRGVGLASSVEKTTRIYRFKAGSYQYIGEFSQRRVDDYIEKLVSAQSSKK